MRPLVRELALLGLGVLALHPRDAAAAPRASKLAVAPVVFEGDEVAPVGREQIANGVVVGLGRSDVRFVAPDRVLAAAGGQRCMTAPCLEQLATDLSATHMLRTTVIVSGRDYAIRVELVEVPSGDVVTTTEDRCEICGAAEVASRVADQAAALGPKLASMEVGAATLVVTSAPPAATVRVDGDPMGTTPFEGELAAGRHVVRVSKDGFLARETTVRLVGGAREQVDLTLDAAPSEPDNRKRLHPAWGGSAIALGAVTLAGGVTLLVLDERPYEQRCSGNDIDINGRCRKRYNTLAGGIVLTVASAALLATGVALLVVSRRQAKERRVRFEPTADGIALRF